MLDEIQSIPNNIEAKRLGIKMGVPWFQLKSVKFSDPVIVFSSNYALYASMSNRIMVHLEALAPRVEQYSIDEMFLDVRGIDNCINFEDFSRQLREHVRNGSGLTMVSEFWTGYGWMAIDMQKRVAYSTISLLPGFRS